MGTPVEFFLKAPHRIRADGLEWEYFTTCSEIKVTVGTVEIYEAGQRHPHKAAGTIKVDDVTLTRPASRNRDLWNMLLDTYDSSTGLGKTQVLLKRTFEVEQLDEQRAVVTRYLLHMGFISSYASGDWDAKTDEARMETVTIAFERAEQPPV